MAIISIQLALLTNVAYENQANTFTAANIFQGNVTLTSAGALITQRGTDIATTGSLVDLNFGTNSLVRFTGASTQTLTGLANGSDGRILTIINAAAQALAINNEDVGSTAANRILTGTGGNISVAAGSSTTLIYDSGASRWRVIGDVAGGAGSGANQALSNLSGVNINAALNRTSGDLALQTTTSGNITLTTALTTGIVNVLSGNLQVGNGAPTVALNGEDAYIEGTLEVDGTSRFDAAVTVSAGGIAVTGNSSIATTAGNTLSVGNSTGLLTFTSAAGNVFNINGAVVTDVEFNRLDGKDANLVDTNDAVSTAITGSGALNAGSITNGFGSIDTGADAITTTGTVTGGTVNATTTPSS